MLKAPEISTPDRHPERRPLPLEFQGVAMPASELPSLTATPISIACAMCGIEMKLVTAVITTETTVYKYQCANGHLRETVRTWVQRKKSAAR